MLYMILKRVCANAFVVLLLKPFNHGVLNITHSVQVSEVLLKFIPVWCHILGPVVVSNHLLVWYRLK